MEHDDAELLERIAGQAALVESLTTKAEESAAVAKADRDELKKARKTLESLVHETIADRPLFRQAAAGQVVVEQRSELDIAKGQDVIRVPKAAPEDAWRELPVAKLEISPEHSDALARGGLVSLGELADFLETKGFRGLMLREPFNLRSYQAKKVRAALDLWWIESRGTQARWMRDPKDGHPGDSQADRQSLEFAMDWLRRRRDGDVAPDWGLWSEFTVTLEDGSPVEVFYEPRGPYVPGHRHDGSFEFWGPLTTTGYRPHYPPFNFVPTPGGIVAYAEQVARQVAAETAKERAKEAKAKGTASPGAAPKTPARKAARLRPYLIMAGEEGDSFERVCYLQAQDMADAFEQAKARIGWQVYNFRPRDLFADGPGTETARLSRAGEWLDAPEPRERHGESIRGDGKDKVPDRCPEGTPRLYEVRGHDAKGKAVQTFSFVKAIDHKSAQALAESMYPSWGPRRLDVRPADEARTERVAKKKSRTAREVRRVIEKGDRAERARVESTPPETIAS